MEMPLNACFSPLTAHSGGQGPFLATIALPLGTYVAMVPGLWRVYGIREGKGAPRGYKRYQNRRKSVLSHIGLRIAPI